MSLIDHVNKLTAQLTGIADKGHPSSSESVDEKELIRRQLKVADQTLLQLQKKLEDVQVQKETKHRQLIESIELNHTLGAQVRFLSSRLLEATLHEPADCTHRISDSKKEAKSKPTELIDAVIEQLFASISLPNPTETFQIANLNFLGKDLKGISANVPPDAHNTEANGCKLSLFAESTIEEVAGDSEAPHSLAAHSVDSGLSELDGVVKWEQAAVTNVANTGNPSSNPSASNGFNGRRDRGLSTASLGSSTHGEGDLIKNISEAKLEALGSSLIASRTELRLSRQENYYNEERILEQQMEIMRLQEQLQADGRNPEEKSGASRGFNEDVSYYRSMLKQLDQRDQQRLRELEVAKETEQVLREQLEVAAIARATMAQLCSQHTRKAHEQASAAARGHIERLVMEREDAFSRFHQHLLEEKEVRDLEMDALLQEMCKLREELLLTRRLMASKETEVAFLQSELCSAADRVAELSLEISEKFRLEKEVVKLTKQLQDQQSLVSANTTPQKSAVKPSPAVYSSPFDRFMGR